MLKRICSLVLSVCLLYVLIPSSSPNSTVSAAAVTPKIDSLISNVTVTQNANKSFTIKYTLKDNLKSFESIRVTGSFSLAYRGAWNNVGITTSKTKGTYTATTSVAPTGSIGWLTFNIDYGASGGTQAYTEKKYVTLLFVGGEKVHSFHTITKTEAVAHVITFNILPGFAIAVSTLKPEAKYVLSTLYGALMYLDQFASATATNSIYHPTAGDYVRTSRWMDYSTGQLITKVEVYATKATFDKNLPPKWETIRKYVMPK